jgi:hypothetical protein
MVLILLAVPNILFAQLQHEILQTIQQIQNGLFSLWGDYFIIPNDKNIFNPTFYADHKSLHFEGRYNYEDINTASAFGDGDLKQVINSARGDTHDGKLSSAIQMELHRDLN